MVLDPVITNKVQEWLNTPDEERDMREGATLMLQLNRNRALYNSVMMRPDKFRDKLVYELKKYLRMRLDNMTVSDVSSMEAEIMPRVKKTVEDMPVVSVDSEIPNAVRAKGKRPDHDSLPDHVRKLWEANGQLHRRIVLLFNELKAMSDALPCDRYEKLRLLDEADKKYRSNMKKYDDYVAPPVCNACAPVQSADVVKAIGAARKTISKYKKILTEVNQDPEKIQTAKEKIQSAVAVIRNAGAEFSESTVKELSAFGIIFD